MNEAANPNVPVTDDGYEAPELSDYGSIEEWTKGQYAQVINVSVIIG